MRKWIGGMAALLLAVWLLVFCTPVGLPQREDLEPTMAQNGTTALYLAENRWLNSCIYTTDTQGQIIDVYREGRRNNGLVTAITQLAHTSQGVYFIRQSYLEGSLEVNDWQLCLLKPDQTVAQLGGGTKVARMEVTGMEISAGTIRISGVDSWSRAVLCTLPEGGEEWTAQSPGGTGQVLESVPRGDGVVVLLGDGSVAQVSASGAATALETYPWPELPQKLSISLGARLQCKWPYLLGSTIGAGILLLLAVAVRQSRKARTLAVRTALLTGICLLATLLLVTLALVAGTGGLRTGESMEGSGSLNQSRARLLEQSRPEAILQEDFYGSPRAEMLMQLLEVGDELYAVSDSQYTVALSRQAVWKRPAEEVLSTAASELVQQVAKSGSAHTVAAMEAGRQMVLSAAPIKANGVPVGVLLSRTVSELSVQDLVQLLQVIGGVLGVMYLLSILLIYGFLRRTTRPIGAICQQMKAVSEGDLRAREISSRRDELGELNRSMQEMCMGLAIRDYEVDSVIQAYHRFVPLGMERLLDRASVMEVGFRDARTLTGSMGLFTVNNRDQARQALGDEDYVQFVSNCFRLLRENTQTHQGQMLAGSFDLSSAPVFYPNDTGHAVQAGLDLMGELERQPAVQGWRPDYFLLIHHTSFLYGIAGTEEQVFPLLSSSEMEFLGGYADRFRAAGVRMVLTEDIVSRLTVGCNTRYIGYVASPDGRHSFKLYEALDTYQDIERNLRIRYDQRLQEGIRLFYHNDFYLARNLFSSLLKACPQDGVVRWYLFACEHFFNSDPGQVDYRLFGIDQ